MVCIDRKKYLNTVKGSIFVGVFLFLALVYSPDHPSVSPSSAVRVISAHEFSQINGTTLFTSSTAMFKNTALLLLVLAGGVVAGANGAWTGVLPQILSKPLYTPDFAGICGFLNNMAGVVGCLASGFIADRWFRRKLKQLLLYTFLLGTVTYVWFSVQLASPLSTTALIASNHASIIGASLLTGFFQGACDPLFYELAAEVTYPLPEGVSAGLITFVYNAAALIMLFVAPVISNIWMNTMMTLAMVLSMLLTLCVKQRYLRSDAES